MIEKPTDETWTEYAARLGKEARFEGHTENPFPAGGLLRQVWQRAWNEFDLMLRERE